MVGWTGNWRIDVPLMICVLYTLFHSTKWIVCRIFGDLEQMRKGD